MRGFIVVLLTLALGVGVGCGGGGKSGGGNGNGGGSGGGRTLTRDFAATDAALFESGYFDTVTIGAPARSARRFASRGCQMDVLVQGTGCVLHCYATAPDGIQVSIDDGPYKTITPTSLNVWTTLTLFSSLRDTEHHVSLKQANAYPTFQVDTNILLTVEGGSPALRSVTAAEPTDWGARQYPVTDGRAVINVTPEAGTLALKATDGYPGVLYSDRYEDGSIILRAKASKVRAWMYQNGGRSKWQVTVDGVNYPIVALPDTGTYNWTTLAQGLNPNSEHEIILTNLRLFEYASLYALQFPGGQRSDSAPQSRPIFAVTGHSIVAAREVGDISNAYYHRIAQSRGYAIASRGVPGSTFKRFFHSDPRFSTLSGEARLGEITALKPAICVIDHFINDKNNASGAIPLETPADLQAALQNYLATALRECPNTQFYILGLLDRAGSSATHPPWDAAIEAAVNAQNAPRCRFVRQAGWIDPETDTTDGTHPNLQGSRKIAERLERIIFP